MPRGRRRRKEGEGPAASAAACVQSRCRQPPYPIPSTGGVRSGAGLSLPSPRSLRCLPPALLTDLPSCPLSPTAESLSKHIVLCMIVKCDIIVLPERGEKMAPAGSFKTFLSMVRGQGGEGRGGTETEGGQRQRQRGGGVTKMEEVAIPSFTSRMGNFQLACRSTHFLKGGASRRGRGWIFFILRGL